MDTPPVTIARTGPHTAEVRWEPNNYSSLYYTTDLVQWFEISAAPDGRYDLRTDYDPLCGPVQRTFALGARKGWTYNSVVAWNPHCDPAVTHYLVQWGIFGSPVDIGHAVLPRGTEEYRPELPGQSVCWIHVRALTSQGQMSEPSEAVVVVLP